MGRSITPYRSILPSCIIIMIRVIIRVLFGMRVGIEEVVLVELVGGVEEVAVGVVMKS